MDAVNDLSVSPDFLS